jgi:hypothetical protein
MSVSSALLRLVERLEHQSRCSLSCNQLECFLHYTKYQSLQVATEVATQDTSAAEAASANLQKETFLNELRSQGLTGGNVITSTIKVVLFQATILELFYDYK